MEGMKRPALLLIALTVLAAGGARAADAPAPAEPPEKPEPVVEYTIIEDDGARIDELKVRGEAQAVTVKTKGPLKSQYEIVMPRKGSSGGAVGQRVWHVLSF
jgi:hypothetical protein